MESINKRVLKWVVSVHGVLLLVMVLHGCVAGWWPLQKPPPATLEFLVDVTPVVPEDTASQPVPPPPQVQDDAIPEPEPPPPPQRQRPRIEVSRQRVTRPIDAEAPPAQPLTEEQIRQLLAEGATPSDRTSIPDADARELALIKTTLDAAWQKPSRAEAGDAETFLRLWLQPDGRIERTELSRASGNASLDASVEAVGRNVQRIHGLSPSFIRRRSPVTVAFTVQ